MKKIITLLLSILLVFSSSLTLQAREFREIQFDELYFSQFSLEHGETSQLFELDEYLYLYLITVSEYSNVIYTYEELLNLDIYDRVDLDLLINSLMSFNFSTGSIVIVRIADEQPSHIDYQYEVQPLQSREWVRQVHPTPGIVNAAGRTREFSGFINGEWHTGTLTAYSWYMFAFGDHPMTMITYAGWVTGTGWHSEPIHYYSEPIIEYLD